MVDQRYSLRWDQYQSHLVSAFENLRDDHDFVDVTLGVGGKKLMAHKMLLSACSPYFRELLKDNPCQHPIILLRDIPYLDLEALLQFMYQGQVSVQQDRLESLLKSAQHLSISGLAENKEDEAKEVIPLPSSVPENSKASKSLSELDKKRKHNKRRSSNDNETSSECNIKQLNKQARLTHTGDRRERFEVKHEVIDVADEGEEERYKGSNHGSSDPKKGEERTSSDAANYQITPASETADQIGGEYDGDDVGVESYPAIDDEDCASQEYYVNEGTANKQEIDLSQRVDESEKINISHYREFGAGEKHPAEAQTREDSERSWLKAYKLRSYNDVPSSNNQAVRKLLHSKDKSRGILEEHVKVSDRFERAFASTSHPNANTMEMRHAQAKGMNSEDEGVSKRFITKETQQIVIAPTKLSAEYTPNNIKYYQEKNEQRKGILDPKEMATKKSDNNLRSGPRDVSDSEFHIKEGNFEASRHDRNEKTPVMATGDVDVVNDKRRMPTCSEKEKIEEKHPQATMKEVNPPASDDREAPVRVTEKDAQAVAAASDVPLYYDCRICERRFGHQDSFMAHKKFHSGLTVCSICTYSFSTIGTLNRHLRVVHKIPMKRHK